MARSSRRTRARPEVLALLADAKAHPADDAPRLILADWLEEHGDPRGTFVRVQVELARLPKDDPRRAELVTRERELLDRFAEEWLGPFNGRAGVWEFRRGLLHKFLPGRDLLDVAAATLAAPETAAWVERLAVRSELMAAAFEPEPDLAFDEQVTVDDVFQECDNCLDLSHSSHTAEDFKTLAASPLLAHFTALDLAGAGLTAQTAKLLLSSPHLEHLLTLNLFDNELGNRGAKVLATSPHLGRLAVLDVSSNHLGDAGIAALAGSPHLANLTFLNLEGNDIGPKGAKLLASSPHLSRLAELNLEDNKLGAGGVKPLAASPLLARLSVLNLNGNDLGDDGACALAGAPMLRLSELCLDENGIGPAGVKPLAACKQLERLSTLTLRDNELGDAGAAALAASPHLAGLSVLSLRSNRIGDAGAQALAASPHLANLTELNLHNNPIGDDARALLRQRFGERVAWEERELLAEGQ